MSDHFCEDSFGLQERSVRATVSISAVQTTSSYPAVTGGGKSKAVRLPLCSSRGNAIFDHTASG